jgi:cyclopropane-fatty-acyl-phospholipid synthase
MMQEDGLAAEARSTGRIRWRDTFLRLADRLLLRALARALARDGTGRLHILLPSGEAATLGGSAGDVDVTLRIPSYRALWRLTRGGSLGFAECFMDGEVETDDLSAIFEFYLANERILTRALPSLLSTPIRDRRLHQTRRNTLEGSRLNIAAHYDLGNDFYRLWLDTSMAYSSAMFEPGDTLEEAQARKTARVLHELALAPGMSILEIGCGWGGMALAAARRGVRVEAITISKEQHQEAVAHVDANGLGEHISIRLEDYRETSGQFDRVVSIEMIEAVGEENWQCYFDLIAERLKPGGLGIVQAITIDEGTFDRYRRNPDFIQRYIFPGGMLPTVSQMRGAAQAAGLEFERLARFGPSYARTLAAWRSRFLHAWPRIQALGFDDRFRRMWLYYLTYCEAGFNQGTIDVGLYRLRKPL